MTIFPSEAGAMGGNIIRIVAALVLRRDCRTLLVRKRGTASFMQPGGKLTQSETPLLALQREIREELGCGLLAGSESALGRFTAPAANEVGFAVEADLYLATLAGDAIPQAEIEEVVWTDAFAPEHGPLAPLTERHVLPIARKIITGWKP